mmetsp:Transcript_48081/g.116811  ORF Transcript_48081/g.116811 Transcript_48081/m.116811 type:complete len:93 (+) Transcript_48081:1061-1339(+)
MYDKQVPFPATVRNVRQGFLFHLNSCLYEVYQEYTTSNSVFGYGREYATSYSVFHRLVIPIIPPVENDSDKREVTTKADTTGERRGASEKHE